MYRYVYIEIYNNIHVYVCFFLSRSLSLALCNVMYCIVLYVYIYIHTYIYILYIYIYIQIHGYRPPRSPILRIQALTAYSYIRYNNESPFQHSVNAIIIYTFATSILSWLHDLYIYAGYIGFLSKPEIGSSNHISVLVIIHYPQKRNNGDYSKKWTKHKKSSSESLCGRPPWRIPKRTSRNQKSKHKQQKKCSESLDWTPVTPKTPVFFFLSRVFLVFSMKPLRRVSEYCSLWFWLLQFMFACVLTSRSEAKILLRSHWQAVLSLNASTYSYASFSMTSKLNHLLTARRSNCQSTMKKPSTLKAMDTARSPWDFAIDLSVLGLHYPTKQISK